MKVFTYIKEKSDRVKNKAFCEIGGLELWKHLLYELKDFDIYVDTDSKIILSEAERDSNLLHVKLYPRKSKFVRMERDSSNKISPALLMVKNFIENYVEDEEEVIVLTHTTSPFLKRATINDAAKYLSLGYDFVHSVYSIRDFAWYDKKPLNFNPSVVQRTQDLREVMFSCGAFFIFTKRAFMENNNRLSVKNPELNYYYRLTNIEAIEIDTEEDLEFARIIHNGVKND